jgi:hypothetical protein
MLAKLFENQFRTFASKSVETAVGLKRVSDLSVPTHSSAESVSRRPYSGVLAQSSGAMTITILRQLLGTLPLLAAALTPTALLDLTVYPLRWARFLAVALGIAALILLDWFAALRNCRLVAILVEA